MGDAALTGLLWEGPRSREKLPYSIAHARLSRELVETAVVGVAGWIGGLILTAAQNTSDLPEIHSRPPAALRSFYRHGVTARKNTRTHHRFSAEETEAQRG